MERVVRYDVWVIGHVTRDRLVERAGQERAGGTATYFALALSRLGGDVGVLTRLAPADEDELLLLAKKIPPSIKKRVLKRPDVFRRIAKLNDKALDKLVEGLDK